MRTVSSVINSAVSHTLSYLYSHFDYHTSRHIVVFESDDWGSIRMSNKKDWKELLKKGYSVNNRPYERFDTLESPEDLYALFEVLSKHYDSRRNHPVITANMLMTNPNFKKIKQSGYEEYHYETIVETYKRYYGDIKILDIMREGIKEGLFMPQSHGREHFNVHEWLEKLQNGDEDTLTAFKYGMCGISPKNHPERGNSLMVALRPEINGAKEIPLIVEEGLKMFNHLWGFPSLSFIAPCYTWDKSVESVLNANGVRLIQGGREQRIPNRKKMVYHYCGQIHNGLYYGVRNCMFEPSTNEGGESVDDLLKQVNEIFSQRKIAIFSTHRINYASGISHSNRDNTLRILDEFLKELINTYPDVEFLSSDKLLSLFE